MFAIKEEGIFIAPPIKENKTLSVNIPAGVDTGDKVRLSGEGEWMKGGQSGDLYVAIRVIDDPIFERDGRELYIEAPVPFDISVIGGAINIPTLENTISLKTLLLFSNLLKFRLTIFYQYRAIQFVMLLHELFCLQTFLYLQIKFCYPLSICPLL